ncbi:MAG TPA: FAD-dependent oxidoreductase, partial [Anaerolineaceae bacterium]|nr:FAD-dependent oxidoreductase [Anaerolineaceae bacterium]
VELDLQRLAGSGVQFHFDLTVDADAARWLLADFDAVFLGLGLNGEQRLAVPGSDAAGVFSALDLLTAARPVQHGEKGLSFCGKTVVVVGGGNVALDAAVVSKRLGAAQVIVLYRRGKDEMPAWESEYLEACSLGVEFRWLSVVQQVLCQAGRAASVQVGRTRYVKEATGDRRWVEADPAQPVYEQRCDIVVLALGQRLDADFLPAFGLPAGEGLLAVELGSFQTRRPGVFAGGEAVSGGATIVACVSAGMAAGREIHAWLAAGGKRHG